MIKVYCCRTISPNIIIYCCLRKCTVMKCFLCCIKEYLTLNLAVIICQLACVLQTNIILICLIIKRNIFKCNHRVMNRLSLRHIECYICVLSRFNRQCFTRIGIITCRHSICAARHCNRTAICGILNCRSEVKRRFLPCKRRRRHHSDHAHAQERRQKPFPPCFSHKLNFLSKILSLVKGSYSLGKEYRGYPLLLSL